MQTTAQSTVSNGATPLPESFVKDVGIDAPRSVALQDIAQHHLLEVSVASSNWTQTPSREILKVAPELQEFHLTATTLRGPEFAEAPYAFFNDRDGELLAVYRLGSRLAGHGGMVHGGFITTILDECMGRACFPLLPHKIAVTARLEIDFKGPVLSNSVIALHARTESIEGRRAWVVATIRNGETSAVLAHAKALFVEPKTAASMSPLV